MEQLALLNIIRTDTTYRFHFDLTDSPAEYVTELTADVNERLRRALQSAAQYMQMLETKTQARRGGTIDSLFSLGRLLFDSLLPSSIQEALRHLDIPLLINANTPEIPWELLYDNKAGYFLCQHASLGRQLNTGRNPPPHRITLSPRPPPHTLLHKPRKPHRREP